MSSAFEKAVRETTGLGPECWARGLRALGKAHRAGIEVSSASELDGSVALDDALHDAQPDANRWDYALGYAGAAYFVEVHPADTKNVGEVLKKLVWLKAWLRDDGSALGRLRAARAPYHWLATGGVHITPNSPQARRLAAAGLKGPTKRVRLPPK